MSRRRTTSYSEYEGSRPASVFSLSMARPGSVGTKPRPRMRRASSASEMPAHMPRPVSMSFSDTLKKPTEPLPALSGSRPGSRRGSLTGAGSRSSSRSGSRSGSRSDSRGSSRPRTMSASSIDGRRTRSPSPSPDWLVFGAEAAPRPTTRPTSALGLPRGQKDLHKTLSATSPDVLAKANEAYKKFFPDKNAIAEQRRRSETSFKEWKAKLVADEKARKAEETKAKAEKAVHYDELFKAKSAKADAAFERWLAAKEEDAIAAHGHMSEDKLQVFVNSPFSVVEVTEALSKIIADDGHFELLKSLLESIAADRGPSGTLSEKTVRAVIVEAEVDIEVDDALDQKAAAEAKLAKAGGKKPKPTESEKVRLQVGKVILAGVKAQRRLFGEVMSSFRSFFDLSSRHEGKMSKGDFKATLDRMDVAIQPAHLLELFRVIDQDDSGTIEYGELKHFLLQCTVADMDIDVERKIPPLISQAKSLLAEVSGDELDELVIDLFKQAETDRLNTALGKEPGKIGLWHFRRGLRQMNFDGISVSQKKDLSQALERVFSALDKNNRGHITWSTLEFFLRSLNMHADRECRRQKDKTQVGWDELSLLRVGKTLINNMSTKGSLFGQTTFDVHSMFAAMDMNGDGVIDTQELRASLRRLDCGLTLSQEEALLRAIDTNGDKQIDMGEFKAYISRVRKNMDDEAEAKRALKTGSVSLMEAITKACKYNMATVTRVCNGLRGVFRVVEPHE
mmetsp:Transcript_6160/g.15785  ORF Transcript_6160/g.15785 Transcript_6160/m.15785 type:complete len:735 (+) Transcript_6160:103-2307(+)